MVLDLKKKRILVCPLNWGLGHGTRIIPIISFLINNNFEVIIAASGRTLELLKSEFRDQTFIEFPDYHIHYSNYFPIAFSILLQLPKILFRIARERFRLSKIIDEHSIDAVISDNRYGLYSSKIPSVFISHQILIKPPSVFSFMEIWIWLVSAYWAQKFSQTWVPDYPGKQNLSGDLSHKYPLPENGLFIGPLASVVKHSDLIRTDILILLSGPETARSQLEKIVLSQLHLVPDLKIVVLLGKPGSSIEPAAENDNHQIISHLERKEINRYMCGAELIISRPGYTTVMEISQLEKKAVWIPTPGQTEQEYLARYYKEHDIYGSFRQKDFNLAEAWEARNKLKAFKNGDTAPLFEAALNKFIEEINSG